MADDLTLDPETWVDRHGDGLYRYALARVGDPEAATELVQETFLDALDARGSFSGRSSVRTWLVSILKHKISDRVRRRSREQTVDAGETIEDVVEALFDRRGHWRRSPRRWPSDPRAEFERREFWDALGRCLTRLPAHLADAFLDYEIEGLDRERICERANISAANLATRLYRARLLLRQCLEVHWFAPADPSALQDAACERPVSTAADCSGVRPGTIE